jgi:hypothetical protein
MRKTELPGFHRSLGVHKSRRYGKFDGPLGRGEVSPHEEDPMEEPLMKNLVQRVKDLQDGDTPITLLAVCPNSDAVLEAAIEVAARTGAPMLFTTTLNQVDRDGGYTGLTPKGYVTRMGTLAEKHGCSSPLYPCLDHGGLWLKDAQRALYALTNSNRSAPSSASRALKRTPSVFVFSDLHRGP